MIYSLQQLSAIFIIHSPIIPIRLESDRDSLKVGMARRRMKSNKTRPSSDNSHMWGSSPSCEVYCRPKVLDWLKSCYGWRNSSGSQQIKIAMAKDTSHIARCELLLDGLPFFTCVDYGMSHLDTFGLVRDRVPHALDFWGSDGEARP